MAKDKEIVHTEAEDNPSYEHPLNFLSERKIGRAVGDDGKLTEAGGPNDAAAIANAVKKQN